ncbi:MAG: response regulator [Patescibacteria group bacterium]|nr:response regulator [Patescibacteria group bacterium]MDE2015793.1 response regulator [Patescibacteria group bacterium]MDE2226850.1 response regulator [Patescibacteria group bacterium]
MPNKKTVMLIEDDKFLSSLVKARLEKEGYGVMQAFDGADALELLKQSRPELIIMDLIMPKVSGFEVLESISLNPELNKTPVIVLSNLAQDSDIEKARRFGAVEFFVKIRVSIDDLVKKVKTIT